MTFFLQQQNIMHKIFPNLYDLIQNLLCSHSCWVTKRTINSLPNQDNLSCNVWFHPLTVPSVSSAFCFQHFCIFISTHHLPIYCLTRRELLSRPWPPVKPFWQAGSFTWTPFLASFTLLPWDTPCTLLDFNYTMPHQRTFLDKFNLQSARLNLALLDSPYHSIIT